MENFFTGRLTGSESEIRRFDQSTEVICVMATSSYHQFFLPISGSLLNVGLSSKRRKGRICYSKKRGHKLCHTGVKKSNGTPLEMQELLQHFCLIFRNFKFLFQTITARSAHKIDSSSKLDWRLIKKKFSNFYEFLLVQLA